MDKVVVDSSVAMKWFIEEDHSDVADYILDEYKLGNFALLAPGFIYAEFGNILWKKQTREGLDAAEAQLIMRSFRALALILTQTVDLLEDAYRLAVTHRRTVYDMLYLALSIKEGCRFVTADERLCNAIGTSFTDVVWLPNWTGATQ